MVGITEDIESTRAPSIQLEVEHVNADQGVISTYLANIGTNTEMPSITVYILENQSPVFVLEKKEIVVVEATRKRHMSKTMIFPW